MIYLKSIFVGLAYVAIVEIATVSALVVYQVVVMKLPGSWFSLPIFLAHAGWLLAIPSFAAGFWRSFRRKSKRLSAAC